MKHLRQLIACSVAICFAVACTPQPSGNETENVEHPPPHIIFDTDMGPDYDDVGAITLLHAFADSGEAKILATIASTKYEGVASAVDVLNTYFGRPDVPIGVPMGEAVEQKDFQHWTDTLIARYPHTLRTNDEAEDAIKLYRRILSQQPDSSVTIITVGFLTNVANLLQSRADEHSPLDGTALVRKKVKKLVSMAGGFPAFHEFNIKMDAASAKFAFENFPGEVVFSGFEIGANIKTGLPLIKNDSIQNSPVKDVFRICINMAEEDREGRKSWDQTAVLVGVRGHNPWYTLKEGRIVIDSIGKNTWDASKKGHFYLVEDKPATEVTALIDGLMMYQPN